MTIEFFSDDDDIVGPGVVMEYTTDVGEETGTGSGTGTGTGETDGSDVDIGNLPSDSEDYATSSHPGKNWRILKEKLNKF